MKKMKRTLLILLCFLVLGCIKEEAVAWSCGIPGVSPKDPAEFVAQLDAAEVVVWGMVLEKKEMKFEYQHPMEKDCIGDGTYVRMQVKKSWNKQTPTEIIFIERAESTYGKETKVGEEFVVYLDITHRGTPKQRYQSDYQLHNMKKTIPVLEEFHPGYTPEKKVSLAWDMKIINLVKFKSTAYLIGFFLLLCFIAIWVVRKDAKQAKGGGNDEEDR